MKKLDEQDLKNSIGWISGIAKQGDARIITVPKKYWENKIIDEDKVYRVYLIEIDKKKEKI